MNHESRLKREQEQQSELQAHLGQEASNTIEFSTPEEVLRHDARNVSVPPQVERKLQDSIAALPPEESKRWWEKFLGR